MPIDPSIAMGFRMPQIEGPLDQYSKFMTIKHAMMQQEQMQQQLKDQQLVRAALQSGTDPNQTLDQLMRVSPTAAKTYADVMKQQEAIKFQKQLTGMTPEQRQNPDFWRSAALATGHPAYASEAERLQKQVDQRKGMQALQGVVPPEGATGIAPTEEAATQQALAQFNNPNRAPGAVVRVPVDERPLGMYSGLSHSPIESIATEARSAQEALNKGVGTPESHLQRAQTLAQREANLLESRSRQQAQFGQQRDMAGLAASLRQAPGAHIPSGYEPNPDAPGTLRPIKGGPADARAQAVIDKDKTKAQTISGLSDDIDALVSMLEANPNIAGGRGIISRGVESASGFLDPTKPPTDAHLYESRMGDLKTRIQLLRADRRYSKAAQDRMDSIIQGTGLGQNAATSIETLRDMQAKLLRDNAGGSTPPAGDSLIYKGHKFPSKEKLDAFKAAGG